MAGDSNTGGPQPGAVYCSSELYLLNYITHVHRQFLDLIGVLNAMHSLLFTQSKKQSRRTAGGSSPFCLVVVLAPPE